ncbi:MAG: sigma-54-dependent transcriptional regulator [Bdellovibrionales bacterium]
MNKILIIDDEAPIRDILSASLRDEGYSVETASNGDEGLIKMKSSEPPQVVFLDIWMPGHRDGLEVLKEARSQFPEIEFIMISGHGTIETAVKATKLGAYDFIEKPLSIEKVSIAIVNALNFRLAQTEKAALLNKLRSNIAIRGDSQKIMQTKQLIARLAPTQSWVFITGESGTGKQLAAQNIHYMSPRASRTFAEINCQTVPEDLLEGEIFGIEKGTLPGLDRHRKGKLELVESGTLYLEEITSLPLHLQNKLLRFMQERQFTRHLGQEVVKSEARLILSTSENPEKAVQSGILRPDFFDRINTFRINLEPLRDRIEDLNSLITHFADMIARETGENKKIFSDGAVSLMRSHSWPGNIRELKNFIERVYILTPGDFVDIHDLRFAGLVDGTSTGDSKATEMQTFREARAGFEKEYLIKKIQENAGNISRTAEVIGLERSYLHRKIKAYGIETNNS